MSDYTLQDVADFSYEQKPLEFGSAFVDILLDRVAAKIDDLKISIAQNIFNGEQSDDENA